MNRKSGFLRGSAGRKWAMCVAIGAGLLGARLHAQNMVLTAHAQRQNALYKTGETAVFTIKLSLDGKPAADQELSYRIRQDDFVETASGTLQVEGGEASVRHTFTQPGWALLYVTPPKNADGKRARSVLAGAMCEPETLQPGTPCPDDFEAFWTARKAELDAMPFAPKMEPVPSLTDDKIETWSIQLKNINGTTIQGFFAKPKGPGPFPAVMAVHAAGVYGIGPGTVAAYARHGALAIDINPHNIPNGKPKEFYADLKKGALRGYPHMGRASRETSYFLRMFCSCYRAAQYITSRPEWDGEKLVVWGSSQGGGQAFVTAGLCSKVSAFTANVPALCDHAGLLLKRRSGWPQWVALKDGAPDPDMLTAGKYFDCANFARLTSATALVSCGFIDRTCSPTSVWAAYNVLQGEKGMENMVRTGHGINTNFRRRQRKFILDQLGLK